ncbi:3-oxoacyl-ACP reductase FabG [Oxalobacter sp. OttesenSCG-928-P03]|nr:3-oxoacyl-ACP reductase FabG [Oxalobacter sp. OttesenSCG-928-P03]
MFKLTNKVAIVSGAAKGIGKGIARTLLQAGAKVIIADIDDENGQQTARELNADFMHLDVTSQEMCNRVIEQTAGKYGRLDILCSNTGIFPQANLKDMTEADWDLMNNVNLKGMFFLVKPALAVMEKQRSGRVIITSSITGPVTGYPGWSHYGATKAGQLGFMRSAALEYARYGITINAVMPGNILTEGLKAQGEAYLAQMTASIPTHTLGEPEDIGYAACFLASDEAKFITGQTIIVDGGQILPESPDALL